MKDKFNLSENILVVDSEASGWNDTHAKVLDVEDVAEFIRRLKEELKKTEIECDWCDCDFGPPRHDWLKIINTLAGKQLTGEGERK